MYDYIRFRRAQYFLTTSNMEGISDLYKEHLNSIDLPVLQREKASLLASANITLQSIAMASRMSSMVSESLNNDKRNDREIHAKIKLVEAIIEEKRGY